MGQSFTAEKTNLTASLKDGQVFHADLSDSQGGLLLAAGMPVTLSFIQSLARRGISETYLDQSPRKSALPQDLGLLAPYNPEVEQQLERNYRRMINALAEFIDELLGGYPTSIEVLKAIVGDYLQTIMKDAGVVLANCLRHDGQEINSHDENLQRRSVCMSMLATVTAQQLKLHEKECLAAGIVGALHDVSLYGKNYSRYDDHYLVHPLLSIDLLRNTIGLSDQMRMIVGQVHEQCDGSGYPRQLKSARLHTVSRILNVVDAYLTLIEPARIGESGYAPSDALAYLVQQALYGCFDRDCVQALIAAASIYPVGTQVRLDDGSSATVLRSTGKSYLQPIIRMAVGQQAIVDLRFSERNIVHPDESNARYRRLPKSALAQVLWRPEAS